MNNTPTITLPDTKVDELYRTLSRIVPIGDRMGYVFLSLKLGEFGNPDVFRIYKYSLLIPVEGESWSVSELTTVYTRDAADRYIQDYKF